MLSRTFLWIEDREGKAGYIFWYNFMKQLYPNIVVQSKKNNSELVKAVKALEDTENKYVILYDNSFDNLQVVMEQKKLKQFVDEKENVFLIDVICFEYVLLVFPDLIEWIFAPDDDFKQKRAGTIAARAKFIYSIETGEMNYKDMEEIVIYDVHIDNHNVEQLAAKLLLDLTRNTGFEVSKSRIGDCWVKSCCQWSNRMEDDICGLDAGRLSVYEKMKSICEKTNLKEQLQTIGLEAVS